MAPEPTATRADSNLLGRSSSVVSSDPTQEFSMPTEDFMKQQYLTLRDEIRESKARIFWLLIIGMLLVMAAGYLAAEHPNAFANAAIPFLLIGVMLSFVSEQNNIARAGRYLRETVEPTIQDIVGWEHWLESKPKLREVDHQFVIGFSVLFLIFFAITTSLTLTQLDRRASEVYVWAAAIAYSLGALCIVYVFWRHYTSSTAAT
jgi:uncharacterized membrane protein YfcA